MKNSKLKTLLFFGLILVVLIFSCTKKPTCEDLNLGAFELDKSHFNYIEYNLYDSLFFTNNEGKELLFSATIHGSQKVDKSFLTSCGTDSVINHYSTQSRHFGFRSLDDSLNIQLRYFWTSIDLDTTEALQLCELFGARVYLKTPVESENEKCKFWFLLDCEESETTIELGEKEVLESVEINEVIYEEVYKMIDCNGEVLFKKGLGVLKFTDLQGVDWYYDRVI